MLIKISRFLRQHNMPETTFGRKFNGDPNFILGLKRGRCPRERTRQKLISFMENYS